VRKLSEDRVVLGFVVLCAAWILFGLPFLYGPPPRFAESARPPQSGFEQAGKNAQANPQANAQSEPRSAAQDAQVRGEKSSTDWWLMMFTGAVALFTLMLAAASILFYRAGERRLKLIEGNAADQSRETKDAIDLARKEFVASHRPRLRVRFIELRPLVAGERMMADIGVANIGVNDAAVISIGADIACRTKTCGWESPGLNVSANQSISPATRIIKSGEQKTFFLQSEHPLSLNNFHKVHYKEFDLCAVGIIKYVDGIGTNRHTAFFRVYDSVRKRFVAADEPSYEYED
jgi:hypothetical protein